MIRLIASDLDGTLIPNGMQSLNPILFPIIKELKKRGILFVSASGRQLASQRGLFGEMADDISYIAENGALCIHNGKCIYSGEMKRDTADAILRALASLPSCKVLVSCPDTCYILSGDDAFLHHVRDVLHNDTTVTDCFDTISEPILKIAAWDTVDVSRSADALQALSFPDIKVATSGNDWIDFIPTYCNKGTALSALLRHLHIDPADCISFGDQQNDVEMLTLTGISYAMESGVTEAKAAATATTACVEHTLQELLEKSAVTSK